MHEKDMMRQEPRCPASDVLITEDQLEKELKWFEDYYNTKLESKKFDVWYKLLKGYKIPEINRALLMHIKTDEFPNFPAFGKIMVQLNKIVRPIS